MSEEAIKKLSNNDSAMQSENIIERNIAQLASLFPELITEGPSGRSVNADVLKQIVGDAEINDLEEKYGFTWHGKREARRLALAPSLGTLLPMTEQGVNWTESKNLMIEGDNLEVLKLLQKSYASKVKLVYIDPPYNTGKDFIYPDDFSNGIKNYLELTGQVEDGRTMLSNPETRGRFHTDWLNMMYPRIMLSHSLLAEDGLIFVSISDAEVANLKMLLDEIFLPENFIAQLTREVIRGGSRSDHLRVVHDYLLCYAKNKADVSFGGIEQEGLPLDQEDEYGPYRKGRELNKWGAGSRREDSPGLYFPIPGPGGVEVFPVRNDGSEGRWRYSRANMLKMVAEGNTIFEPRGDGSYIVYQKIRSEERNDKQFTTLLLENYTNNKGTEALKDLFGTTRAMFDYAKPVELIRTLMMMADLDEGDLVLDFFAGSGTTGHAVYEANLHDGKNCNFILVQLPEIVSDDSEAHKLGFENIFQVTRRRVELAADRIGSSPEFQDLASKQDLGFRVFRLAESNIEPWSGNPDSLEASLLAGTHHLREGRTEDDILYEILLKLGLDLCTPIMTKEFAGCAVKSVGGVLFACLSEGLSDDAIEDVASGIIKWHEELGSTGDVTCIFRDSAFASDAAKVNLAEILSQSGIKRENIKSL